MASDSTVNSSSGDKKLQMYADADHCTDKHLQKSRLSQMRSYLYPTLLALILLVGTTLLVITVTRRNTCRQLQEQRIMPKLDVLSADSTEPWISCVRTSKSSSCVCPASFIHSPKNPSHCIPSHSHCLQSCKTNLHCSCHKLNDVGRCREVTRNWIENELQIGSLEPTNHNLIKKQILQYPWSDNINHHLEHLLANTKSGERLFFSSDRRTGITIHEQEDDYLLNERWTKFEANTTQQHIAYTQLDPQAHTCRMSWINDDGAVNHGLIHTCPGETIGAPYFFGVACENVLVLWQGSKQSQLRQEVDWAVSRHHFESNRPHLPVLLDPFHRYYSLYDDLMMEIKDLNGNVLGQLFTNIYKPNKFEFIDAHGTILIANHTHMQFLRSTDKHAWLDM
ncbi:hypothetical protein I4U23_024627 [Adineta vaga]|nr:hypothetical protein I4U23_024627 [Adineta vaga]